MSPYKQMVRRVVGRSPRTTRNSNGWFKFHSQHFWFFTWLVGLLMMAGPAAAQTTWFVDADGAVDGGCTSWADACPNLQTAMGLANPRDAIWVAAGSYFPDGGYRPISGVHVAGSGDRGATFQLTCGVAIYGGFAGDEDPGTFDLADRDYVVNETKLSGDLIGDDTLVTDPADLLDEPTHAENSYHIVTGSGTDAMAILDGFTITGGNANDIPNHLGGGMLNEGGSPTVSHCIFVGNAAFSGGGIYNSDFSMPVVTDCTFRGNRGGLGGGMGNENSDPTVSHCSFSGNSAGSGGGMSNKFTGNPIVKHCTFSENFASLLGGGVSNEINGHPEFIDCVFRTNTAKFGGGISNSGGESTSVIDCTFRENTASILGGGVFSAQFMSLVLRGCVFIENSAPFGGGMHNIGGSITVTDSLFIGNSGSGMRNTGTSPTVTNTEFTENIAELGGGIFNTQFSNPVLTNCIFRDNTAQFSGGGIYNQTRSDPWLTNCEFIGNSANFGGGIYSTSTSTPTLTNCLFEGNSAVSGGGVSSVSRSSPKFFNCTFNGNSATDSGGGMFNFFESSPTVANCTFTGNSAGSGDLIHNEFNSFPIFVNCILWGNAGAAFGGEDDPIVSFSNVEGGFAGMGNIDADPLFVDPLGPDGVAGTEDDNLRLLPGSPCIDAGDNTAVPEDVADLDGDGDVTERTPVDLDGNPRFVDDPATLDTGVADPPDYSGVVDMGAHEFQGDCNGNGIPDACEIDCGATDGPCDLPGCGESNDCNANGIPDECEEDFDTTPPEIVCEVVPVVGDDSEDSEEDSEDEGDGDWGDDKDEHAVGGAHPTLFTILFDAWDDCGEVDISAVVDIGCMRVPVEKGTFVRLKCKDGCRVREKDDRLDIEAPAAMLIVTAVDESGNTSSCEVVLCVPPDESEDGGGDDDSEE